MMRAAALDAGVVPPPEVLHSRNALAGARPEIRKQGIEVMREIMLFYMGKAAQEQRSEKPNDDKIFDYLRIAGAMAKEIAPFETPRLSAVLVKQDDPNEGKTVQVRLKIGERTETIITQPDGSQVKFDDTEEQNGKPAN